MSSELPNPRATMHEPSGFLERIFAEQHAPLTRYAARLLGDADRARDVVQDTFVKLMARDPAEVDGYVVEWLFTVCRHRAVDVGRKEGRMMHLDDHAGTQIATSEPRPGSGLEAEETQVSILKLIEHLPHNQQEVIRLKFQNGFSYKEISRITELSVSNVGFLIHTAVTRLRREMAAAQG